jgi:2',3'-cyclic-nucleotide 2'-phosphodiesterase (5'-nucleotidase family)
MRILGRTLVRPFFCLLATLWGGTLLGGTTRVTLLQFADYHSHALPFYSEGRPQQGGIARAIGYLSEQKRGGALVFSGGDMINKGSPSWSDKYRCAEWSWFNGIVDAMALGNHDADYGNDVLAQCRTALRYPILSANTAGFGKYEVFERKGLRIGVFALAGPDFPSLMKASGLSFSDSVAAATETVRDLRNKEKVDAVVLIGHEQFDDDIALARAVPGIDLIFGSHSHRKGQLERDAAFPDLALDVMREVSGADAAISTASSFRQSIAPGPITLEALRAALPYDNEILVVEMTGRQLQAVLDYSASRRGSDFFSQMSGVRFIVDRDGAVDVRLANGAPLDLGATYHVATTDYQVRVALGYRELFAGLGVKATGLRLRSEVQRYLAAHSPVSAAADGRIGVRN